MQAITYVGLRVLNNLELKNYFSSKGVKTKEGDLTMTLCYSRKKPEAMINIEEDKLFVIPSNKLKGLEFFGDKIVLLFEDEELESKHSELIELGATHDYEKFNPHITIGVEGDEVLELSEIELPSFDIVLTDMWSETFIEDSNKLVGKTPN